MANLLSKKKTMAGPTRTVDQRAVPTVVARVLDSDWTYRLLVLAGFIAVWEVSARQADSLLIASASETVLSFGELLTEGRVWNAFFTSNQVMVVGYVVAMGLGVPIGLLLGRFSSAENIVQPYLNVLLVSPTAIIIPLLIMATGIGFLTRLILVVTFALIYIVVNCRAGVRQVDTNLIEMARSFGASEGQLWKRIILPGALPAIMAGARLGLGRAVEGMVLVELLMVAVGIGNLVLVYRGRFEAGLLYGTVILVVAEGLILIHLARRVEERLTPWVWQSGLR